MASSTATAAESSHQSSEDGRWIETAALSLLVLALLAFAGALVWEVGGPLGAGHDAATASVGIAALNMNRWGILVPVLQFTPSPPQTSDYYCNHPWGLFWTTAVLVRLLGAHDWVLRIAPLVQSVATPVFVYLGARELWGPCPAALAATAFTVTPIALAFGDLNGLEVPIIFGWSVAVWALPRFARTGRRRYLAGWLLATGHALNTDWVAFVFAAVVLAWGLLRAPWGGREGWLGAGWRRWLVWWVPTLVLVVVVAVFYLIALLHYHQLEDLVAQGRLRAAGWDTSLWRTLMHRSHWLELSFTPIGIGMGVLALPVFVGRVLWARREAELLPLTVLGAALFQYLVFKQGADVHVFWPQHFALYLAYGVGVLVASLRDALWRWGPLRRWALRLAVGVGALVLAVMLPDAVTTLGYARRTGKRFDDGWRLISQDADEIAVFRHLAQTVPHGDPLTVSRSAHYSWALEWAWERPVWRVPHLTYEPGVLFVDARFESPLVLEVLAEGWSVSTYGPFWVARFGPPPALSSFRLTRREPSWWQWYFVDAHDPQYGVEPDTFAAWEICYHFRCAAPPPESEPQDSEQRRVAHNLAVALDPEAVPARRASLLDAVTRAPILETAGGTVLVGHEVVPGVAPRLRLYVRATGATAKPWRLRVLSRVDHRPYSTVRAPHRDREIGMPFAIPSTRWRPGFIYVAESEIRRQPGVERFFVELVGPDEPRRRVEIVDPALR